MNKDIKIITEDSFETWFLNRYTQEVIDIMAAYDAALMCIELADHKNTLRLFKRFNSEILQMANLPSDENCDRTLKIRWENEYNPRTSIKQRATNMVRAASNYLACKYRSESSQKVYAFVDCLKLILSTEEDLSNLIINGRDDSLTLQEFCTKFNIKTFDDYLSLRDRFSLSIRF